MKKRLKFLAVLPLLCICVFCAFTIDSSTSVKTLTKPYINTYECTSARLGNEDLLEKYEYFKITMLDGNELEVSFKRKNGKRHAYVCGYTYDSEKQTLSAEIGILGFKFKQDVKISEGKFTLCMPILGKTLVMNFAC